MKKKLETVYKKYYETKAISTIKDHIAKTMSMSAWKQLKVEMDAEHFIIPNLCTWVQDFMFGGTSELYMANLLFEAYTHTVSTKQFNMYGNIAFGDMLTAIRSCNDYHMEHVIIKDFGIIMPVILCMKHYMIRDTIGWTSRKQSFQADLLTDLDWFTRCAISQLCIPEEHQHTTLYLNYPNQLETELRGHLLEDYLHKFITKKHPHFYINSTVHQYMVNSAYFAFQSGLKLREGFTKPSLIIHEGKMSELEKTVCLNWVFKNGYAGVQFIQNHGMDKAIQKIMKEGTPAEIKNLKYVIENGDKERTFISNAPTNLRTHCILHSRKTPPEGIHLIADDVCDGKYDEERRTAIATCIIDVDKILFDNATKTTSEIINKLILMYTQGQDINMLRKSLQSVGTDWPLLVIFKINNEDLQKQLNTKIKKITTTLSSTYEGNFKYEFRRTLPWELTN